MARTVADAFNQYHQNYVKPQVESKLATSAAAATYATQASLALKADLDSPHFTGTPTAPTPDNDTDSTQLATTEFVQNLIRRLMGAAPETLDTLVELATAINNDPNFAQTIVQALDGKLNKTDAATQYLGINANAVSATRDGNGNVISSTYATKDELGNAGVEGITNTEQNLTMEKTLTITDIGPNAAKIDLTRAGRNQISGNRVEITSLNCAIDVGANNRVSITASDGLYVNGTKIA